MFRGGIHSIGQALLLCAITVVVGMIAVLALAAGNAHGQQTAPSVSGTVFDALNKGGVPDPGVTGLQGRTVYADFDGDSVLDADEPFAVTDATGSYSISIEGERQFQGFVVREQLPAGWDCSAPSPCSYEEQPFYAPSERAVQTPQREGRDFANVAQQAVAATQAPAAAVAGKQVVAGSATLGRSRGCSSKRARVSVSGRQIANVSYYLDSRKLWTVVAPDSHGRFSYTIKTSRLKAGVHRVRAQVTFVAASATASKALSATIQRCATRATPKFTG